MVAIAKRMQEQHLDSIPHQSTSPSSTPLSPNPPSTSTNSNKKDKSKPSPAGHRTAPAPIRKTTSKLPQPPSGTPLRVSQLSPAQEGNILIETVKAGMSAPGPGEGGAPGGVVPGMGGGKGKRKVVRVR